MTLKKATPEQARKLLGQNRDWSVSMVAKARATERHDAHVQEYKRHQSPLHDSHVECYERFKASLHDSHVARYFEHLAHVSGRKPK